MTFKEFLQEATATANPEKAKAELEKIAKELEKYFKAKYDEKDMSFMTDELSCVRELEKGRIVMLECNFTLRDKNWKTNPKLKQDKGILYAGDVDEINAFLKKAMKEAKKVIKDNGLEQNKDYFHPASKARAEATGIKLEVDFWIGFNKV